MRLSDTLTSSADGWTLVETGWDAEHALAVGSNFMVGNGYLGYRGTAPDESAEADVALVVSDTYDMADGRWRELCTVPNPLVVRASVDGVPVTVADAEDVQTSLDLRSGEFRQQMSCRAGEARIAVTVRRVASAVDPHLLAQRWEVTSDRTVDVVLETDLDTQVWSLNGDHFADMQVADGVATGHTVERGTTVVVAQHVVGPTVATVTPNGAWWSRRWLRYGRPTTTTTRWIRRAPVAAPPRGSGTPPWPRRARRRGTASGTAWTW